MTHLDAAVLPGRAHRLRCTFSNVDALGYVILWCILTILTLGLALLVFPYYLNINVLNRTEVIDAQGRAIGRLSCRFGVGSAIGNLILWAVLILITFGLASFLYVYRVLRVVLNETTIDYY